MPIRASLSASTIISRYAKDYAAEMVEDVVPNPFDGLKKVHRRALWAVKDFTGEFSTNNAVGRTKEYHVHSDTGIYDTIVRMSQSFVTRPPLFDFTSSIGSYHGDEAAATRYTDMKNCDYSKQVFFGGIHDKAIPMMLGEDRMHMEPRYFIPAIPTALLYHNLTIGYGHPSKVAPIHINNVCELVMRYAMHREEHGEDTPWDVSEITHLFLPEFPIRNSIDNYEALKHEYAQGNFTAQIEYSGWLQVTPTQIIVKTLPYGLVFKELIKSLRDSFRNKNSWADVNLVDVLDRSTLEDEGDIVITLKPKAELGAVLEHLLRILRFSYRFKPIPNYNINGVVVAMSPIDIIKVWYRERHKAVLVSKRHEMSRLTFQRRTLETYLIVCDRMEEVIAIITTNTEADAAELLKTTFSLTENQAQILLDVKLRGLSMTSRAALDAQLKDVLHKISLLTESFLHVDREIYDTAKMIRDKFGYERMSVLPKYIGCIQFEGWLIQVESQEEIEEYLNLFVGSRYRPLVQIYAKGSVVVSQQDRVYVENELPRKKYIFGKGLVRVGASFGTLYLSEGTASYLHNTIHLDNGQGTFCHVPSNATVIMRDGRLNRNVLMTEFAASRKSLTKGSKSDVIYAYPNSNKPTYVLALNPEVPNVITAYKIDPTTKRISINVRGNPKLMHVTKPTGIWVNIGPEYLKRCIVSVVYIPDLEEILDGKEFINIEFNKRGSKIRTW